MPTVKQFQKGGTKKSFELKDETNLVQKDNTVVKPRQVNKKELKNIILDDVELANTMEIKNPRAEANKIEKSLPNKETVDFFNKIKKEAGVDYFTALLKIQNENGNPKINVGTDKGLPFSARRNYNPFTNEVNIPKGLMIEDDIENYIKEVSHAGQPFISTAGKFIVNDIPNYIKASTSNGEKRDNLNKYVYDNPNTVEFYTHNIVEPKLIKQVEEDIKNPQFQNGGKHTNSEQNFLKDYFTAQTFQKGGQKTDKERQAYAFFISKGWKPEQAIGIVGNLKHESNFDTTVLGTADDKGSRAIAQWHGDRLKMLKNKYGENWTDFKNQLEFVDWELRNTHKTAGDKLRNSKGVWEAGRIVSDDYEIPKVKFNADERRQRNVADLAMKFKGIKLTPEDNINYGVTFENSVAPYMNAPQIKETPLATIQIPEMQTQQVSYLDTPQETTNLAEETEAKPSKINPQEEAFMQDLLSQMAEGVGYVEPQKSAVFQDGGQIPISSEGMYAYPNQPVIIPSSRITMKNIPHSILAVTDQGDRQILQPEKEYQLKGNNTLEIPLTKAEENFLKDLYS